MAGIVCLFIFGNYMVDGLKKNTVFVFNSIGKYELTNANVYTLSLKLFLLIIMLLAPLVVSIILTAFLTKLVQDNGQIDFNLERLTLDFNKISPFTGFGKIFNKDSLLEILKSLVKLFVVGYIAYRVLKDETQNISFLAESDI